MWPMASSPGSSASTGVVKISATWPMDLWQWISRAVAGADAGALLSAVLQRVEAQVGQLGGFGMAVDGDDAALVVELIEHDDSQRLPRKRPSSAAISQDCPASIARAAGSRSLSQL